MPPTPLPPALRLRAGDVLVQRFRVVRFLARGGMGDVFEAQDLELSEPVALKVIRPDLAGDEMALARFRREIQLSHRVTHPNVCRIFDLFRQTLPVHDGGDIVFVTMELLVGTTLAARIREKGPLDPVEALPLAEQMCEALAAAHRVGVVHRDFKSANVMLVPSHSAGVLRPPHPPKPVTSAPPSPPRDDGTTRAVVTDFGIARTTRSEDAEVDLTLTLTGDVLGTPAYMSPEQLEGQTVGPTTDIYALGIVLFEMVTGRRPFEGPDAYASARERLHSRAPSPRVHRPDLPRRWDDTIQRCLERDPEKRFASAVDVAGALRGEASSSSRPRTSARPARLLTSGFVWVLVLAGILLGVLAIAFGNVLLSRSRRTPAHAPLQAVQLTSSAGLDVYPAFAPDGSAVAYASDRSGDFEIVLRPLAGGLERPLTKDGRQNLQPAFSPDGSRVAYVSTARPGIWLVPTNGGATRQITQFGSRPAFSPDGELLAFQSDPPADLAATAVAALPPSVIWVVSVKDGQARAVTRAGSPPGGHGAPVFTPDGKRIVFAASDTQQSSLYTVGLDGAEAIRVVEGRPFAYDPAVTADGRSILHGALDEAWTYSIVESPLVGRGEPVLRADLGTQAIRHLTLSRDGRRVAWSTVSLTANLHEVSASGGDVRALTKETARSTRPAFSPDGARLAFNRWRRGAGDDVWVMDAIDGTNAEQVTLQGGDHRLPAFFPDGTRIGFMAIRRDGQEKGQHRGPGTRRYVSLDLVTKREEMLLTLGAEDDFVRLSPDGTRVAWGSRRAGSLDVWVAALPGGSPRPLTGGAIPVGFPCWAPDGRTLAVQVRRGDDMQVGLVPEKGGTVELLTTSPGQSWPYSFSPDGSLVAFAGLRGGVWNLYTVAVGSHVERPLTSLTRRNAYARYPAFSPRGDRVVFEYGESTGNIWTAESEPGRR